LEIRHISKSRCDRLYRSARVALQHRRERMRLWSSGVSHLHKGAREFISRFPAASRTEPQIVRTQECDNHRCERSKSDASVSLDVISESVDLAMINVTSSTALSEIMLIKRFALRHLIERVVLQMTTDKFENCESASGNCKCHFLSVQS
jgi:hypothetical protein